MKRLVLAWLLAVCLPGSAGIITGRVFVDSNGDGAWQVSDTPRGGVLVSDGQAVVVTAADGTYTLAAADGRQVVFIENPLQTWPTQGFWRSLPTGSGNADFPLRLQEQALPFVFVQGTDMHVRRDTGPLMARYVEAVNALPYPPAFVVHTGDLVVDVAAAAPAAARELFAVYQSQVASLQAPLFNLPGNHEHVSWYFDDFDAAAPEVGKGLYREVFGPTHYAFTYAGVRFIALDGTDYKERKLVYSMPAACVAWLRTYLQHVPAADRLVLLCHEPLHALPQKAELEQALAGRAVVLSLSGHWHSIIRQTFAGAPEIVGGATSYAWHGPAAVPADAKAYHVVRITETGFESAFGDWAERYPVTIATPTHWATIGGRTSFRVLFLDPNEEVRRASVRVGTVALEIGDFGQEGLCRTAAAELDLSALHDGFHDVLITLQGQGEPFVELQRRLVQNNRPAPFAATGPATLRMLLSGVNAANVIRVNGTEVGTTPDGTAPRETVAVDVPAALLQRLNRIEFESVPLANGGAYDDFAAGQLSMAYGGKTYRDPRSPSGATATVNGVRTRAWTGWIDLSQPAP